MAVARTTRKWGRNREASKKQTKPPPKTKLGRSLKWSYINVNSNKNSRSAKGSVKMNLKWGATALIYAGCTPMPGRERLMYHRGHVSASLGLGRQNGFLELLSRTQWEGKPHFNKSVVTCKLITLASISLCSWTVKQATKQNKTVWRSPQAKPQLMYLGENGRSLQKDRRNWENLRWRKNSKGALWALLGSDSYLLLRSVSLMP